MAIISFRKQFADDVKRGNKRQTIRKPRKYPIKEGDTLYLYTGLRTKNTVKLKEAKCTMACGIEIFEDKCVIQQWRGGYLVHNREDGNTLAQDDGFKDWEDMTGWFEKLYGLPFKGTLIKW